MTHTRVISRLGHPHASLVQLFLLAIGLGIFVGLSWQIGLREILFYLQSLGWKFVLVLLPYLLVFGCDTLGWQYAFERTPPVTFLKLLLIQIMGKAVGVAMPLAPIGGGAAKAYFLQTAGVPLTEGLASVVISRTAVTIAQGLFILSVTGFTVVQLALPMPLLKAMGGILCIGAVLFGGFLLAQRRGLFAMLLGMARKLKLRFSALEDAARELDSRIIGYYRHRRGRFILAFTLHLLGWLAEGLEVYVLLQLLDLPRSPGLALSVVAFSSAVRGASFMIPASLGIQEGGNVFIFMSLGLSPDAAMAFSMLHRLREVGWFGAGLLLMGRFRLEQRCPTPLGRRCGVGTREGLCRKFSSS